MGVRNLESYLEKNSSACYQVNIPDIIRKHREETGLDPVIVIDALTCLRFLYRGVNWLNGGQFKEYLDQVDRFIQSFTRLGCRLVVFFDGPIQDRKLETWKKRKLEIAFKLSQVLLGLDRGVRIQSLESQYKGGAVIPSGLPPLFIYALSRHKNCSVITSIRECDEEIGEYARRNNCVAILAQDTDFVIYRAAPYYLSIKRLNLETMTTNCYSGELLAKELRFPVERLPLFASLLGNDIIPYDSLADFHNYLKRLWKDWNVVKLVGKYVGRLTNVSLLSIARLVFRESSKAKLIQESISSYDLSEVPQSIEMNRRRCDDSWQNITELAKKKCIEGYYNAPIYDIVMLSMYNSGTCLETYNTTSMIKPIGTLLKELRRAIYGILLKEKPLDEGSEYHYVDELVMTGMDSMEHSVQVKPKYLEKVKHPGLIGLWTCKDEMQETRWNILAEVFTTKADKLKQLPPYFLVPVLATRYFKMQYKELKEWEVDALISCNVCVRNYESEKLAKLPTDPLNYRQVWIYSAITMMYSLVSDLLFYIGEPIPFEYVVPHQYTDGKLFHEKYRQASQQCPQRKLVENQVESTKMFNRMKTLVMG